MKEIYVTVEGGVIQDISNIPEGVRVVVRDYDIESIHNSSINFMGG